MNIKLEKNYRFIPIAIFFVFLVIIFYVFSRDLSFPESDYNFKTGSETKLYSGGQVTQVFSAQRNNLNQIKIALRTGESIGSGDEVLFQLADADCQEIIATDKITRFSIISRIAYKFNFKAMPDSQNKSYCLMVSYLAKNPAQKNVPEILISKDPQFEARSYTNTGKGGEFKGRTLVMRPAYGNDNFFQDLTELDKRISQYKPWFFKGFYLAAIFTLFLISSLVLVLILVLI